MPVVGVIVADIGKRRLVTSVSRRLVDTIDYLLEILMYGLSDSLWRQQGSLLVQTEMIVFAEILGAEIIEYIEKLTESNSSFALCGKKEGEVAELPAETAEILWGACSQTIHPGCALHYQWVQRNGLAVILYRWG